MAGSYRHCVGGDGKFHFALIENMGDAHEACEQMFYMINYLARGDPDQLIAAEESYYRSARSETDGSLGHTCPLPKSDWDD